MAKVEFAPRARLDLEDIDAHLSHEAGVRRAKSVLRNIRDRIDLLTEQPRLGPAREEYGGRRILVCRPYVAIYAVRPSMDDDLVVILRIVHGARDIPRLLSDER